MTPALDHGTESVLFTGGRAPVTLELARLFARAGHRVLVAESLALPLTRCSRAVQAHYRVPSARAEPRAFAHALREIVQRERVALVVPTCEEVFHVARAAPLLAPHTRVFVAPFRQLRRLHSKFDFIAAVLAAGLEAPATERIGDAATLRERVRSSPGALVLKPEYSRFATETVVRPDLPRAQRIRVEPGRPWVVQEYMAGRPVCAYGVAHQGRLTAYAAYDVSYTAGLASSIRFAVSRSSAVFDWVRTFVQAEAFTGQIAFDFVVTPGGRIMPLECNPRATSGIHLFADQPELAQAFLSPAAPLLHAAPRTPGMLAVPMLLYGLPRAREHGGLVRFVRDFAGSRDVVFRRDDPLPALLQGAAILELATLALRHGRGLLSASTVDIEYNGEDVGTFS